MEKHLLVTVSEHSAYSAGLRFACGCFDEPARVRLTLLYVMPPYEEASAEGALARTKAQSLLDGAQAWAASQKIPFGNIETKALARQFGVLRDIIEEARKGLYDAAVVGSRYLSRLEQMYEDSVSRGLLWEAVDFPVWICHQPDAQRRNLLLCLDGDEASYRIADHAAFMLHDSPRHSVTLLHFRREGMDSKAVVDKGRDILLRNGMSAVRINTLVMDSTTPVESILRIADEDSYAVVAVGRNKRHPDTFFSRLFTQSVTLRLKENTQRFALWVSQ
ncbi:universal stress protein [Oleidesulfovibrio sp.]|uniref:universal stress protein n=1 Tax=Oleidesulfovibrio sp. TaxID=2909707 RepID=UPI003A842564